LPVIVVIAGLLGVGDVAARRYATGQISDRVSASSPEASGVHSRIHSFPFIGRLLVNGNIPEIGTHIDHLAVVGGLSFSDLDVDLHDVSIDRHAMLSHRQVRLTRIGQGKVSVGLTQESLSSELGRPVRITGGGVLVTVLGTTAVQASVSITGRQLVVRVSGLSALSVPLPTPKLLPCDPQVTLITGRAEFSCTFTGIPSAFVQAAAGAG
jgi:hypothetical protein